MTLKPGRSQHRLAFQHCGLLVPFGVYTQRPVKCSSIRTLSTASVLGHRLSFTSGLRQKAASTGHSIKGAPEPSRFTRHLIHPRFADLRYFKTLLSSSDRRPRPGLTIRPCDSPPKSTSRILCLRGLVRPDITAHRALFHLSAVTNRFPIAPKEPASGNGRKVPRFGVTDGDRSVPLQQH